MPAACEQLLPEEKQVFLRNQTALFFQNTQTSILQHCSLESHPHTPSLCSSCKFKVAVTVGLSATPKHRLGWTIFKLQRTNQKKKFLIRLHALQQNIFVLKHHKNKNYKVTGKTWEFVASFIMNRRIFM